VTTEKHKADKKHKLATAPHTSIRVHPKVFFTLAPLRHIYNSDDSIIIYFPKLKTVMH